MGLFSSNKSSSTTTYQTTTNTLDLSGSVGSLGLAGANVTGGVANYYVPTNLQIGDSALQSNPSSNPTVTPPSTNPSTSSVFTSFINSLSSTNVKSFLIYGIILLIILHIIKK